MLNNDYKILTKALSLHMKLALPQFINEDQVSFMQGRYIGDNILSLSMMINHINKNKESAILISFDFEKAFDMVAWTAVNNALRYFGFGDTFIGYVNTI